MGIDQEMDGFRWLTVNPPGRPDQPMMLVVPKPPAVDPDTAEQLHSLIARGYLGLGALQTDDCLGDLPRAHRQGGGVHRAARRAVLRHRRRVPRPVRQRLEAHPTQGSQKEQIRATVGGVAATASSTQASQGSSSQSDEPHEAPDG